MENVKKVYNFGLMDGQYGLGTLEEISQRCKDFGTDIYKLEMASSSDIKEWASLGVGQEPYKDYLSNLSTDNIVQAYTNNNHVQLKNLIQEVFSQSFTQGEYESFIRIFQRNQWTWEGLIKKFNDATYKRNVFQYVLCKPY